MTSEVMLINKIVVTDHASLFLSSGTCMRTDGSATYYKHSVILLLEERDVQIIYRSLQISPQPNYERFYIVFYPKGIFQLSWLNYGDEWMKNITKQHKIAVISLIF